MENASNSESNLANIVNFTVIWAEKEREENEPWETEICYGGEADLHELKKRCKKNPVHLKFIPVGLFGMEHLPAGCHDNDLVDLVRALSDLTVRLSVKRVSDKRPDSIPGSDVPFPCYKDSGSDMGRFGTGFIWRVDKYPNKYKARKTCECDKCLIYTNPETRFAHIGISTAAHVVYDQLEATHTTCNLFYDEGNMPNYCKTVVTLNGMQHVKTSIDKDLCEMTYVTHDMALADRLDSILGGYSRVTESIRRKYERRMSEMKKASRSSAEYPADSWVKLAIVVSHPHGCSKQVSIGHTTRRDLREYNLAKYTYNTSTCPGSSGARVCVLGGGISGTLDEHIHSGGDCKDNCEANYCGYGLILA